MDEDDEVLSDVHVYTTPNVITHTYNDTKTVVAGLFNSHLVILITIVYQRCSQHAIT